MENEGVRELYAELCVRSGYSENKGIGSIHDLVKKAETEGVTIMCLADYQSTEGYNEFLNECNKAYIKPLFGVTLHDYKEDKDVVLIAYNNDGIRKLNELTTANICKKMFLQNKIFFCDDIVGIVVAKDLYDFVYAESHRFLVGLNPEFKEWPEKDFFNQRVFNCVYFSNSYCITKEQGILLKSLGISNELYLRNEFSYEYPSCLTKEAHTMIHYQTVQLAEKCSYSFSDDTILPNEIINSQDFSNLVIDKAKEKYGPLFDNIKEKLINEIDKSIESKSYINISYFYEMLKEIPDKYCFVRGLAGNSIVCYVLGITNIDPIQYNLNNIFIYGADNSKLIDIDVTVPSVDYIKVVNKLIEIAGEKNVAFGGNTIMYDVEKCLEIAQKSKDDLEKLTNRDLSKFNVFALQDTKSKSQLIPSAYFVKNDDASFFDFTSFVENEGGVITQTDTYQLMDKLVKFDIFNYKTVDIINQLIAETNDDVRNVKNLDIFVAKYFNQENLDLLTDIPEFENNFTKTIISKFGANNIEELSKIIGLSRGTNVWKGNQDRYNFNSIHQLISSRDDVLELLMSGNVNEKTAFTIAEQIRRGRGIKETQKTLLKNCGFSNETIRILEDIKYLFPKSHLLYFAYQAVYFMYYKVNYRETYDRILKEANGLYE